VTRRDGGAGRHDGDEAGRHGERHDRADVEHEFRADHGARQPSRERSAKRGARIPTLELALLKFKQAFLDSELTLTGTTASPGSGALFIAGHQGLISPFLTRDHEVDIHYRSIYSIYPARFAGSDAAVALLTHDHGPSVTGTFTESESGAGRSV
jgi:hypothetical protein